VKRNNEYISPMININTKKYLVAALLFIVTLALIQWMSAKPALAKPIFSSISYGEIDAYIEEQMQRLNLPGVSLVIVEGDQITYLRGFGQAHPDGKAPSPQTSFFIGSTTKSFTALAVMQLVEAGKVDLDVPVQRYLPWFQIADSQASTQITVRHLLNQSSSLPLTPGWQALADFDDRPDAAERQARALSDLELSRPVGSAFEYSNVNYNLLGLIIEAASGESYADYIQNHIFDPLGMSHSYTSKAAAKNGDLAVGHQTWFGFPIAVPDLPVPKGSLPSGQLISSAEDMGHYLIAQLNGGRYGEAQVLSPEGIAELHSPAVEAISAGVPMGYYGMGWYIEELGQTKIVHHTGMIPDFYTYMALLPEQEKGVVMLVNANHFMNELTLTEVGAGVTSMLAGDQPAPIQFGAIPWVLRGLLLIPLLQIVGVVVTRRQLGLWRRDTQYHPSRRRIWGFYILPSVILNLILILSGLAVLTSNLRGFLMLFMPDLSWLAVISGSFALAWTCLRTGLILRTHQRPGSVSKEKH
jgi:CubicO group peptidase (beta-lactamase class C family)